MTQPTTDVSGEFGLVIGEAFIDLIAQRDERGLVYLPKFGGSPLNVAVGLRRLGTPVKLAATLAPGGFGDALREFCANEDVDIATLSSPVERAFVSVATPHDGHVAYEYYGDLSGITDIEAVDPSYVRAAVVVHASSTALNADPARETVRRAYEIAPGFKSLDPNPRPSLISDRDWYLDGLASLYPLVDLVKVSDEDLRFLCSGVQTEEAALAIHRAHGTNVIVTGADAPTLLASEGQLTTVVVPPTIVVDATGAGDSFTASLLADVAQFGVPDGIVTWHEYMRRANAAAAATCQGAGGAESMPTVASLNRGRPQS